MPIATYPHIIEALRNAAAPRRKDGFRELAEEMDLKASSLGNLLNPYGDREVVKLGLEQAMHIMRARGDYAALRLIAAECGFALVPLYARPDKASVEAEMLDDVQAGARYQSALTDGAPRPERVLRLAELLDDLVQTETARREEDGEEYRPGRGWADAGLQGG